jgi:hypothetical protein
MKDGYALNERSGVYVGRKVMVWVFLFIAWAVKTRDPGR